jgi:hypothetical protein
MRWKVQALKRGDFIFGRVGFPAPWNAAVIAKGRETLALQGCQRTALDSTLQLARDRADFSLGGEKTMTWIFLAIVWIFLFLIWHAHTVFDEDD